MSYAIEFVLHLGRLLACLPRRQCQDARESCLSKAKRRQYLSGCWTVLRILRHALDQQLPEVRWPRVRHGPPVPVSHLRIAAH